MLVIPYGLNAIRTWSGLSESARKTNDLTDYKSLINMHDYMNKRGMKLY